MSTGALIKGVPELPLVGEDQTQESALLLKKDEAGVYASQQMRTGNGKMRHYGNIQQSCDHMQHRQLYITYMTPQSPWPSESPLEFLCLIKANRMF